MPERRTAGGPSRRPTREEAIRAAAEGFARAMDVADSMSPAELAQAAWTPTCGRTVAQLEDQIRADRGLPPLRREDDGGSR